VTIAKQSVGGGTERGARESGTSSQRIGCGAHNGSGSRKDDTDWDNITGKRCHFEGGSREAMGMSSARFSST
jgi:hypothetical protein